MEKGRGKIIHLKPLIIRGLRVPLKTFKNLKLGVEGEKMTFWANFEAALYSLP